jgi:hypothetical protein
MFGDLMGKMQEAQKQMEALKSRLNDVYVDAESNGGIIKVTANGNKKITDITIDSDYITTCDKDELEDLLIIAVNRAIEKAEKVNESEMQGVARGMMPGLGGLFK